MVLMEHSEEVKECVQKLEDSGLINRDVFTELLDLDLEDNDFFASIIYGFFTQVDETFTDIDQAIEKKDLMNISQIGHFLKGSSATLGLKTLTVQCERIESYGKSFNLDDFESEESKSLDRSDDEYWIVLTIDALKKAKEEFRKVDKLLRELCKLLPTKEDSDQS